MPRTTTIKIEQKVQVWRRFFNNEIIGCCQFCEIKPNIKISRNMRQLLNINVDLASYDHIPNAKFGRIQRNKKRYVIPICDNCHTASQGDNFILDDISVPMDID